LPIKRLKYEPLVSILLWLGFSALGWYLADLRLQALDFHTRDYAYYTEFIIKLFKPSSEQYYSINPGGYNFLTRSVVDGGEGFYQWVHIEPIRFVQALIYGTTQSVSSVFFFNALLICSPILGFAKMTSKRSGFFVFMALIVLFIAFPATMLAPGYDNRPSVFLGVGYFWIIFFYLRTKSQIWQFLSFIVLFLVREEALILNATVCVFVFIQVIQKKHTVFFLIMHILAWVIYAIVVFKYYSYWDYVLFQSSLPQFTPMVLVGGIVVGITYLIFIFARKKYDHLLFLPMVVFGAQLISLYQLKRLPDESFSWYNDPRWTLVWPMLMAFGLYFKRNRISPYLVSFLAVFFVFISLVGEGGLINRIKNLKVEAQESVPLFKLKKELPRNTILLTDYTTHQCFIGNPQLYCVNRLPCYYVKGAGRFYPENKQMVQQLMENGVYIIVTTSTANNILPWVEEKGFSWNINPREKFQIVQLQKF
jgi:hypothetical protein